MQHTVKKVEGPEMRDATSEIMEAIKIQSNKQIYYTQIIHSLAWPRGGGTVRRGDANNTIIVWPRARNFR